MKIAIMQPYLFPYIGYFQLVNAVDKFVFYDDVNFIKQGWINRNNILLNGEKLLFSFPVEKISSFKKINEVKVNRELFNRKKKKFLKTLALSYKKAPFYNEVTNLVSLILNSDFEYISDYSNKSIIKALEYLNINTEIISSSNIYKNDYLKSTARVLDICQKEDAKIYINFFGGRNLYRKSEFKKSNIDLLFLRSGKIMYRQFGGRFISNLSIIDILMFNSKSKIKEMLNNYELS